MIVINGDSWGCGELVNKEGPWERHGEREIVHGGLAEYFYRSGQICVNLSSVGSTNLETVQRLEIFLIANQHLVKEIKKIYIFQTEWSRDIKSTNYQDKKYEELKRNSLNQFYRSLSNLAIQFNVRIYLIGGASDISDECLLHRNLQIACKSIYNLVTKTDSESVYDLFLDQPIVDYMNDQEHKLTIEDKQKINRDIEIANNRLDSFKSYRDLFYPDGYHANRKAHKILFDFLQGNVA